jgi:environmental stress-induced protein Ves
MPWKNGGGTTTEIYREDDTDGEMLWRVSIAGVSANGPFSTFPGYDRHIMNIEGEGMTLDGCAAGPLLVPPGFVPVSFSGDWSVSARLVSGAIRDFNLIARRASLCSGLESVLLDSRKCFATTASRRLVYVFSGQLTANRSLVETGHSCLLEHSEELILEPEGGPARIAICTLNREPAQYG